MEAIAYKVVFFYSSDVFEFYESFTPEDCLGYKIGEKTVPKFGRIFVFLTKNDAMSFISYYGKAFERSKILEGIAENPRKIKIICRRPENRRLFWELKKNKKSTKEISGQAPFGSYVCDSFTPTKEADK